MAVDSRNSQYDKYSPQWKKIRDCYAGQDTIHAAKESYLPKLSGQTDSEYKAYVGRAVFYGATSRTVDGLTGMLFRKPPTVELPPVLKDYAADINLDGLTLDRFAEEIADDVVQIVRAGILVDHPSVMNDDGTPLTIAMAQKLNLRPFLRHYKAENITNWKTATFNNVTMLSEVRLLETIETDSATDEFDNDTITQYRVLDFNPAGVYRQRIFRKDSKKEWVQHGDDIIPMIDGNALPYIPFVFVGGRSSMPAVEKPPMIDLANVNLSHYKTTADLEHGAHFTGLPTAVISGLPATDEDMPEYVIGAATAWVFPNPDATAKFLEFEGQGLGALEKRLEQKEKYMAHLGARMLADEKRGVEAAETAGIRVMGENSVLSSISQSISDAITQALQIMAEWGGITGEIKYALNRDFMPQSITPQMLLALIQSWQTGSITHEILLQNLKRGEIVGDDVTIEDLKQDIADENPFTNEDLNNVA